MINRYTVPESVASEEYTAKKDHLKYPTFIRPYQTIPENRNISTIE